MPKKNVTVYDIAAEAGVSIATVSRVLTGNAPVRESTRQRVEAVIGKYNFQPSAVARSLSTNESMTLGFIQPDITNPFFSSIFGVAETRALAADYTMILCNTMSDHRIESKSLRMLAEKQVDGIIFMGGRINRTRTDPDEAAEVQEVLENIPIVMINGRMRGVDCHIVRTNERQGVFDLVAYLAGQGHRTLGLLGGVPGVTATDLKVRAFRQAAQDHSLEFRDEWIIPGDFSIECGEETMTQLLALPSRPTAVLGINDLAAIGAIKAARQHALRVPEDIAVTGFDDIHLAEIFPPGITTVSHNFVRVGQTAVDVMIGLLNGDKVRKETVIDTQLIVRNSA